MLILAGVAISMAVGDNGVIERTQEALKENERADVQEIIIGSYVFKVTGATNTFAYIDIPKTGIAIYENLRANGFTVLNPQPVKDENNNDVMSAPITKDENENPVSIDINVKGDHGEYEGTVESSGLVGNVVEKEIIEEESPDNSGEIEVPENPETPAIPQEPENNIELISDKNSYVGYYADIENDGIIDGIIYADLAENGSGQWCDEDGIYSYTKKETLDEYYISQQSYKYENFEEKPVIVPMDKEGENDRFYVMAFEDFTTENLQTFYWYANANGKMNDYSNTTSVDFGTGKNNTLTMLNKVYGDGLKDTDIWKNLDEVIKEGWFVPSRGELSAFLALANQNGMTRDNYDSYGLKYGGYWTSSQRNAYKAWRAISYNGNMNGNYGVNTACYLRLSTTY